MRISDWSSDVCSSDLGGLNPFEGLTSVLCVKSVHASANAQDFLGLNLNVRRHALSTARRLVNHDSRIGQRHAHTRLTRCQQRSEEHTSELQSLMRISYAVFCLKKKQ